MNSIEETCFWLATRSVERNDKNTLQGNSNADIVIIGAGFTGLWTALFLKQLEPAKDVLVVEQGVAGYGGSGRNAGIVGACLDHSHALAIKHFGKEEALRLAAIGKNNIDELAEFAVSCDFERNGQLMVALCPAQLEGLEHNRDVATEFGIGGYQLLNKAELQNELNSPLYHGGAFISGGGIVNPVKLVGKIRDEAARLGVRFIERCRVLEVSGNKLRCESGTISCNKVVLATDSYSHQLFPQLLWHFIPLYDYIIVSEPLSVEQQKAIGWKNRQGVVDCRNFFNYYRLTADNRILWGTSEALYYAPNRVDESCDHSDEKYSSLRESFLRHFPQISELKFNYQWGGPIASTTRLTPFFGSLQDGKVVYGLGYTGHGIGSTRVAGKILAHMALSQDNELTALEMVQKKPFPYPPEPLRGLAVNLVSNSLRAVDAGSSPNLMLKILDILGIGFSS